MPFSKKLNTISQHPGIARRPRSQRGWFRFIKNLERTLPIAPEFKVKTANEVVTSSITLQADDDLGGFLLEPNKYYKLEASYIMSQSVGNFQFQHFGTPSAALSTGFLQVHGASPSEASEADVVSSMPATLALTSLTDGETCVITISGFVLAGATPGVLDMSWSQETSSGNATTLHLGSWQSLTQIT